MFVLTPIRRGSASSSAATICERRVFVVDDNDTMCRAIARLLGAVGFDVETFNSGDEFLQRPLPTWEDCLLVDVDMPGISGPELRDVLRERGCDSPLIFITAHEGRPIVQHLGPEPVLFKPIDADVLIRAIADACERG